MPTEYSEPTRVAPGILVLYGNFKIGKTFVCTKLPNHMFLSCEPRSSEFYKIRSKEISGPRELNQSIEYMLNNDVFYDFLIVDTISKLDEWSEIVGTINYMRSPQGKKWNRVIEGDENSNPLGINDPRFQSVHSLGEGYGYRWSRDVMMKWFGKFEQLIAEGKVKHVILLAHVKDKLITSKTGDSVLSLDLNLTGKVKSNYAANSDAVGYMFPKKNERYISFKTSSIDKIVSGNRSGYLADKNILISVKNEETEEIETFWESIFPNINQT